MSRIEAESIPEGPLTIKPAAVFTYLCSTPYRRVLSRVINKSQDFEQGTVASWSLTDKHFVTKQARYAEWNQFHFSEICDDMERQGILLLVLVHTHTLGYGNSWSFIPSPEDLTVATDYFLQYGKTHTLVYPDTVVSLILPSRYLDMWAWQSSGGKQSDKNIRTAFKLWEKSVDGNVKTSDVAFLEKDLKNAGLRIVRGQLERDNIAESFAGILAKGNFSYGVRKVDPAP